MIGIWKSPRSSLTTAHESGIRTYWLFTVFPVPWISSSYLKICRGTPHFTKRLQSPHQWALTLISRLKEAHSGALTRDLQAKQRRVADSLNKHTDLEVSDTVMMQVSPKPGYPSKLQSRWQGPYVVVKCLQVNMYRIKNSENFRIVINFVSSLID